MHEATLNRYIELRRELSRIEAEIETVKPQVVAQLRHLGGRLRTDDYELQLRTYTAWDYSPAVTELQSSLNLARAEERRDGTATIREQRDMLVLRSLTLPQAILREEPAPEEEWIVEVDA